MLRQKKFITALQAIGVAVSVLLTVPAFAESAPVYDADTMQQDVDASTDQASNDQSAYLPMPPAPGQENNFAQAPGTAAPVPPPAQIRHRLLRLSLLLPGNDQRLRRLEDQVKIYNGQCGGARRFVAKEA